jgi:hypothetical protein
VIFNLFDFHRSEGPDPDVKGDHGNLHSLRSEGLKQGSGKMKTRCRGSNRTVLLCENGLITISIQRFILPFYIRRKRDVADLLEDVCDFGLTGEGNFPFSIFAHLQFTLNPIVEPNPGSPFYLARPPHEDLPFPLSSVPRGDKEKFTSPPGLFFSDQPRREDAGVVHHKEVFWMEII